MRTLDPILEQVLDRANPNVAHFVEVHVPDVAKVLRRATDQFLASPPLVGGPLVDLAADPAGALTLQSTPAILAQFLVPSVQVNLPRPDPTRSMRGLRWTVDLNFGRAVLKRFSALIHRHGGDDTLSNVDLAFQVYRLTGQAIHVEIPGFPTQERIKYAFVPLLQKPVVARYLAQTWDGSDRAWVQFDLTSVRLEVGSSNLPAPSPQQTGEQPAYYFVIEPVNSRWDDAYQWLRDTVTARTIANVGAFADTWWFRPNPSEPQSWFENFEPAELVAGGIHFPGWVANSVPAAKIEIETYPVSAQAIYAITLPAAPQPESTGRIVFERGVPPGALATLELSTAGAAGPWTEVHHDDAIAVAQQNYHERVTLTSNANHRLAPRIAAMGIEFRRLVDVTAEAVVETIPQQIDVPFLKASIGEGRISVVRTGRRDYRDPGSDLVTGAPASRLEMVTWLGSYHPRVTRDTWLALDRGFVSDRQPTPTAERFTLLSFLKSAKKKIPARTEAINFVATVVSATANQIVVAEDLPETSIGGNEYGAKGYYLRVRQSAQAGIETGYVQTIDSSTGRNRLDFTLPLPGILQAGDVIEVHSGTYIQAGLTWLDLDPAVIWWEILTDHLGVPTERIGRADLGANSRSGLPPTVANRAPGDTATQAKLKVTLHLAGAESADELLDQLSFIMGGATVEIGGQIVFRQIYPLRDKNNQIIASAEAVAAVFDARNTTSLDTPVGLERRITTLACDYGLNTAAVGDDVPAALTTNFVDADALAWLASQDVDDLAAAAIPDEIARWCYNSADEGLYLASMLTQQVVRAASTGLRVWSWGTTDARPDLTVGDTVVVVTDQYTDYDPARKLAIRGPFAYPLVLVSVENGGRKFRGLMLGLSEALEIRGGPGTLAVDDEAKKGAILDITFEDSADGGTRTYTVTVGLSVALVLAHHHTLRVGTPGDPFDFSGTATDRPSPELDVLRPAAVTLPTFGDVQQVSFTLNHPSRGFQTFIAIETRLPGRFAAADVYKANLDPAPSQVFAKIRPAITNATAALTVTVGAGVSDWPIVVDVIEDNPDNSPLATATLGAPSVPGTAYILTAAGYPGLGGRALPLRTLLLWWVRITNVGGEVRWFGPVPGSRDPLPNGNPILSDYRAAPTWVMPFDEDTDSIRLTTPLGKSRTFDSAELRALGVPATYTVGDELDDASNETALGVDETRGQYKVEYQGGGQWMTMWGPGPAHGIPSNPPTLDWRVVKNALASTEDAYATLASPVNEKIRLYVRDSESPGAPVYGLVVGAGDSTPLYVNPGTEIGPAHFFVTGVASPVAKLSGIALTRDQIKRLSGEGEGQQSGVKGPWIPVTLSLMEQPWLESISGEFDIATHTLRLRVKAGAHTKSVFAEASTSSNFAAPYSTQSADMNDGDEHTFTFVLSGAQLGKTHYLGVTPFNAVANGGLAGVRQVVEVAVPAPYTIDVRVTAQNELSVVIDDPASVLHPTDRVKFWVTPVGGSRTLTSPTTAPGSGTTGTYTKTVTLSTKHDTLIGPRVHFADGSTLDTGEISFDPDDIAEIAGGPSVAYNLDVATVTATFDSDTATGSGGAEYNVDGGAYASLTVDPTTRKVAFNVTASPSAKQTVRLRGKNGLGVTGPEAIIEIDVFAANGPSLSVYAVPGATSYTVVWVGTGTVTLSVDGAAFGTPPASPITVTRDTSDHVYSFKAVAAGQTQTAALTIPAFVAADYTPTLAINAAQRLSSSTVEISWSSSGFPTGTTFNVSYEFNTTGGDLSTLTNQTSPITVGTGSDPTGSRYKITIEAVNGGKTLVSRSRYGITLT